jgi:hypothetical protein
MRERVEQSVGRVRTALGSVERPGLAPCLLLFIGVRAAYWATGGGFNTAMLEASYQLLDHQWLRGHPFESATLIHIQPPLFNLFVGSVLRWSILSPALAFQLIYLLFGLTIVVALYTLLTDLGFPVGAVVAATCVIAVSPMMISYENTLTYEYPTAMLLVLAGVACFRAVDRKSVRWLALFCCFLTLAVLVRALFHPIWLAASLILVTAFTVSRSGLRRAAFVFLIPIVAVGAVLVKNQILFGDATMSSWFGMNLARGVISPMPRSDVERLVAEKKISPAALVPPLSPYAAYEPLFGPCQSTFSEPVLRSTTTSAGITNFNAECFLKVYADEQHNSVHAAFAYPGTYLRDRIAPFAQHFSLPPTSAEAPGIDHFGRNPVLRGLAVAYTRAMLTTPISVHLPDASIPLLGASDYSVSISLVLLIATLLLIVRGAVAMVRLLGRRARDAVDVTWVFLGLTTAYVTVISIAIEYGENQRFRAMIDPLLIGILLAETVTLGLRAFRSRRPEPEFEEDPQTEAA